MLVWDVGVGCWCGEFWLDVAGLPDGSFGGRTYSLYGSSFEDPGQWGRWSCLQRLHHAVSNVSPHHILVGALIKLERNAISTAL
jgi:hypothetical protein